MIDRRSPRAQTMLSVSETDEGYGAQCILSHRPDEDELVILSTGSVMSVVHSDTGRYRGSGISKDWHGQLQLEFTGVKVGLDGKITSEEIRRFMKQEVSSHE